MDILNLKILLNFKVEILDDFQGEEGALSQGFELHVSLTTSSSSIIPFYINLIYDMNNKT